MTEWTMVLFILKTGNIDESITHLKKIKILENLYLFARNIHRKTQNINAIQFQKTHAKDV